MKECDSHDTWYIHSDLSMPVNLAHVANKINVQQYYKEIQENEESDLISLSSTIDLVLDLDLDHPKHEKEQNKDTERIATSYGVLLQRIEEQNSSPKNGVFLEFQISNPVKMKG